MLFLSGLCFNRPIGAVAIVTVVILRNLWDEFTSLGTTAAFGMVLLEVAEFGPLPTFSLGVAVTVTVTT